MKKIGLYIHIPFCIKKCPYCDFNSIVFGNYFRIKNYFKALEKDIALTGNTLNDFSVKTIYLGGGTPSVVKIEDIAGLLKTIYKQFRLAPNPEITIEANPASVDIVKLKGYKKAGINRISIGVQSFNNKFLKVLGRAHNSTQAYNTLTLAKKAGFKKLSVDLIYGLPGQTLKDWKEEIENFLKTDIGHISFYDLKIEKGTLFYRKKKEFKLPDNDLQALMYKHACKKLVRSGYRHYEISSFAFKAQEALHNQIYWHNDEYSGLGAGAYSYIGGRRFRKSIDIDEYQKQALSGNIRYYHNEELQKQARLRETLILNLRLLKGFSIPSIEKKAGMRIDKAILDELSRLKNQGLICNTANKYRLSKKGILFYDSIASELIS